MFALGQFTSGLAGGLLAVFGISSAIRHLDERLRIRVVAASSAMWIVPALAGPAATLGLEHLVGWRWILLVPVPFVLFDGCWSCAPSATTRPSRPRRVRWAGRCRCRWARRASC